MNKNINTTVYGQKSELTQPRNKKLNKQTNK